MKVAKTSPVTVTVAVLAIVTFVAAKCGVSLTTEEAAAYFAGAAVLVNNRARLVTFIRGAKQYLRDLWAAARS